MSSSSTCIELGAAKNPAGILVGHLHTPHTYNHAKNNNSFLSTEKRKETYMYESIKYWRIRVSCLHTIDAGSGQMKDRAER